MKILAIDPGYDRLGVAVLEKEQGKKEVLMYSDCFQTSSKLTLSERIFLIGTEVARLIKKYKPDLLAIETLFMTTNQKTVMGVSEARGVIIYEASRNNLGIREFTPLQIKIAVASYGRADKEDVRKMVKRLIVLPEKKQIDDEIDAIAVGLTAFAHERSL